MEDYLVKSYHYDLPPSLIAERPAIPRDASRLFIYDEERDLIIHETFKNLPQYLEPETCLVHNNSQVFPCRLKVRKTTGAAAEIFLLSLRPTAEGSFSCLIKSSSKKRIGDCYQVLKESPSKEEVVIDTLELVAQGEDGTFFVAPKKLKDRDVQALVQQAGKIPIPPYIRKGESDLQDLSDYQTLYAKADDSGEGSVAAPTAGLHFTEEVFEGLRERAVERSFVTLHVGLGTFRPVKTENIKDHHMHAENFFVTDENWKKITSAKKRVAVGTTSLRVLESLWPKKDEVKGGEMNETSIFLYPGVNVQSIEGLLTNFHLPESTLLMLVSSLIGREKTLSLYREAVKEKYRFFSYGDAMLILRKGYRS